MIDLGSHVEEVNSGFSPRSSRREDDEGVDLEVREVKIDINGVETDEEVYDGLLELLGNVRQ